MKKTFFYGYIIVLSCFVLQMVMFAPRASFGVFIKPITSDLDWSRALVAGAFSLSSLVTGFFGIIMGWLNDRLGPRIVLTISGILVGAGLTLMSLVQAPWQLYLFYVALVGPGMGSLYAPQMSTVARWFVKRRNIMTGILMAGGGIGGLIGPPLITWLIYNHDWHYAFLVIGIVVFILIILLAQFLKRDPSSMGQIPYGAQPEINGATTVKVATGLTLKQALGSGRFWMFAVTIFCFGFSHSTIMVHLVPMAIDRGISPSAAATILSTMNLAMTAGSITVGLLGDKIGSRKSFIICISLLIAVALFLLPVNSPVLLGLFVTIMAFGGGGAAVLESSMTADLCGMKSHGAILGCIVFSFTIGGALGPFLGGAVFDSSGNYQFVLFLCGALDLIAIVMAVLVTKVRKINISI